MSNLTLIIGNKNYSSWSLRPWILLKHHHIDFQEKKVPLFSQTTDEELSDYNSDYKVPILKDNELVIWDSLSILEYISEQYLENHGWPVDPHERSIAIRFYGYSIPLPAIEERYMKSVLNHPSIIEWIDASKRETEVIQSVEIDTQ